MIPDPDICHAADLLMERYGADHAALMAAQTSDEMLAKGDEAGHVTWKAILDAILELQRAEPKKDERVN